jgi:hypothetical protein
MEAPAAWRRKRGQLNVRIEPSLHELVKQKAELERRAMTEVVVRALENYVSSPSKPAPTDGHSACQLNRRQSFVSSTEEKCHSIYYIQWEHSPHLVKIGYSSTPQSRIASFLTGSTGQLTVLRLEIVASAGEERQRHSQFQQYRHSGEWFRYEGALKQYIQSLSYEPGVALMSCFGFTTKSRVTVEYF